jgi:hypothetical protein
MVFDKYELKLFGLNTIFYSVETGATETIAESASREDIWNWLILRHHSKMARWSILSRNAQYTEMWHGYTKPSRKKPQLRR